MKNVAIVAGVLLLVSGSPAHAYTCDDVRRAVATLSKEAQERIRAQMTPKQIAEVEACLKGKK